MLSDWEQIFLWNSEILLRFASSCRKSVEQKRWLRNAKNYNQTFANLDLSTTKVVCESDKWNVLTFELWSALAHTMCLQKADSMLYQTLDSVPSTSTGASTSFVNPAYPNKTAHENNVQKQVWPLAQFYSVCYLCK